MPIDEPLRQEGEGAALLPTASGRFVIRYEPDDAPAFTIIIGIGQVLGPSTTGRGRDDVELGFGFDAVDDDEFADEV